jgi:hypothetical protein
MSGNSPYIEASIPEKRGFYTGTSGTDDAETTFSVALYVGELFLHIFYIQLSKLKRSSSISEFSALIMIFFFVCQRKLQNVWRDSPGVTLITADDTWCFFCDPQIKRQTYEWKSSPPSRSKQNF